MTKNSLVIGVAGGSGSGKSTFAKRVRDYFADEAVLISCDNYYLAHDDIPIEKRAKLNYDIPEAFEFDLMIKQMAELKSGKSVECPVYDFTVHTRSGETIKIDPKPVVIIDGILALYEEKLRDVMDVKVFVETDADERILGACAATSANAAEVSKVLSNNILRPSNRCITDISNRPSNTPT